VRWNIHSSRRVYDSQWVRLRLDDVELPNGDHVDHRGR
jgi:hypothetical protein